MNTLLFCDIYASYMLRYNVWTVFAELHETYLKTSCQFLHKYLIGILCEKGSVWLFSFQAYIALKSAKPFFSFQFGHLPIPFSQAALTHITTANN